MDLEMEFDQLTGMEQIEAVEQGIRAQLNGTITEAQQLIDMRATPGWRLYESFVRAQIDKLKEQLVDENDPTKIKFIQAMVRAYSNCIGAVLATIAQGNYAREELLNIVGPE